MTVKTGTLLTGTDAASIKARYVDALGNKKGHLLSEGITLSVFNTPMPEPAGLGLMATALVTVAFWRRRA